MKSRGTVVLALLLIIGSGQSTGEAPKELCGHTWEAIDDDREVHYIINICENLKASDCGGLASFVCAHDIRKNTSQPVGIVLVQSDNNVLVYNTSVRCPGSDHTAQSIINLVCGKSLGTPEFVKFDECVNYFEWRTFTACKKNKFKPIEEVPCYVFDVDYKKHDLNPLIRTSGGYLVNDWDPDSELYINVCRTIGISEGDTSVCPAASSACLVKDGKAYDIGRPKEPLKSVVKERLVLHYETDTKPPDFCNNHQPAVTITFICPTAGTEVTSPRLTANTNCRYEIEWVTENACHTEYLESDDCKLVSKERGISIDLTPLKGKSASPYHVEDEKGEYVYYLNVCDKASGGDCSGEMSSCQYKKSGGQSKGAGSYKNQTLRYSDGDITLTYPGGEKCSSDFQRMTVINFECNETAVNDGKGVPEFDGEADCTYFFSWETKYACPKKEDLCHVESKKKHFNLLDLIRSPESSTAQNWEALKTNPSDKNRFYINVCHEVLQRGGASGCEDDAAICAVDSGGRKNLGKFLSSPKLVGDHIVLEYTEGSECAGNKRIQTNITLICSPGNLESPPILKQSDSCLYEFEWNTAAACVLSKTEGDNCRVSDSHAGFYFDLSPLTKKSESYVVATDQYDFYINVCSNVTQESCDTSSGACQMTKTKTEKWNIGVGSSKLSYYDGMIQLSYTGGTPYNDVNKTPRSSLITFLCDRDADIGQPEYQKEDNNTYNFKWYTKYACPALSVECIVVDEQTNEQYDLSSLSMVHGVHTTNWFSMDESHERRKKYYINVCRSLIPITGCDPFTSVCQMQYTKVSDVTAESVEISNLGVASKKPVLESSGKLILEYSNGSACTNMEGVKTTYSSVLHLVCKKGATDKSPIFVTDIDCVATFLWYTEAACPVKETQGKDCKVENPNTGFVYNLESLRNDSGYVAKGNGKTYKLNICGPVNECGLIEDVKAAGCEFENNVPSRPVQISQLLDLSSDFISLTYHGAFHEEAGQGDMFTINFVCNDDLYPGELVFKREEINSETHLYHTFFDFKTAMACSPSPVDCQVTDTAGNEYDLSDLSQDAKQWIAVDTSDSAKNRTFYLSVCKPLPVIQGCPGGVVGSCMKTTDNKSFNLGFIQMSPQVSADGTLTIVYMSGDKCRDNKHYSTRIIFQCDHNMGSPVFQELDDCEYVFLWRTSEACPVIRAEGDNCQVTDPKYGHIYDLKPLGAKNVEVKADEYLYQFRVCGEVTGSSCTPKAPSGTTVSSCQVKGSTAQLAGLTNQKLIYENGLIMINYIGGDLCHQKHNRTTLILFYCDKTEEQPVFMKETTDCIYMFQWRTPLACPPFKPIDCSFKDTAGNSYDLSALSHYTENWEAEVLSGSNRKYHLNICKPLVPESGLASCPYGAAACLIDGTKAISLGKPSSSPRWDDGVAVLQYTNGDRCPDGLRNRTATIRFMCDLNQVFSKPQLITALDDCEYNFLWITPAACKLKINTHDDCKVTNPATGYLFDLSLLSKDGYVIRDRERSIKLNICTGVKPELCDSGAGVCVSEGGKHWNAGKAQSRLTYSDQVLRLVYDGGDQCIKNPLVRHQSVFTFVCGSDPATGSLPSFVSFSEDTCTWQFSWHTSLVCEKEMKCSVQNGTSNINLGPLIKHVGSYEVLQSNHEADSAVFYINLCQPLNEVVGAKCPPGAAACRVGSNGDPIDIGHPTSPQIDPATQTVSIKMDSSAQCDTDKQLNYSTIIIFRCNKGIDPGSPKFVQEADCNYVFEWGTPLVCSDEEIISGCSLMDQQLHYTFNLSSLSVKTYSTSGLNPYYIGVCSAAGKIPSGKCDGAVCLQSGNTAYSYGNRMAMKMEYRHLEEMLVLQYAEGDPCPPVTESGDVCILPFTYKGKAYSTCISEDKDRLWCPTSSDFEKNGKWAYCSKATDKRSSTIFFKCDEDVANGAPALVTDTKSCSATFEWKTQLACIPRKLDCKFIINRKTYDLRMHSSLTGSWSFASDGSTYYLNLCQRVNQGPSACSASASVCQERNGKVQVLGQVHTQNVTVKGDIVSVTYSGGDACGNDKRYSTTIELTCANVTGKPTIKKYNSESCQYIITWETRAACAVIPNEVVMTQGIIRGDNGARVNLSNIYTKSYNASGDVRVKDQYMYEIQLSGRENSAYQTCKGASVCQVKKNGQFTRAVGASNKAKYYIDDDSLEAVFSSNSKCGKDPQKNATSTIFFHCSQTEGEGRPEFLHETADCQYLFSWYTGSVCSLMPESSGSTTDKPDGEHQNQYQGLSGRSQAVGAILSILLVILVACLVVLLLYKKERRETVMYKLTNCCRRSSSVSYKYTKINTEEEMDNETEWLMEEVSGGHSKPHHENGHVRSVKAGAFTSLHVDDLDSEDEVLTVPEVRIQSARNQKKSEKQPIATYPSGSDENLIGVFNGGQEKTRKSRSGQQNKEDKLNVASFHDDSDEDMLNI